MRDGTKTTSDEHQDMPELALREIPDLLDAARVWAMACRTAADDDMREIVRQAHRIMLEIRVPRMPDDAEELAALLEKAEAGPTYTTDEVLIHLEEHGRLMRTFLADLDDDLEAGRWREAAMRLAPPGGAGAPPWRGSDCVLKVEDDGERAVAGVTRDGTTVRCVAIHAGAAIIGAILLAHVAWHDVWER